MINLITMGLSKMVRSLVFRIGMIIMALYPVFIVMVSLTGRGTESGPLDGVYNSGLAMIGLLIGAFVSILIGQDYTEKTVNNKIMAGHSRISIYLADFIVAFSGVIMMQVTSMISGSVLAIPLFGMYTKPLGDIFRVELIVLCILAVYTAASLFVTTIVNSKNYAVAASMIITILIFFSGMMAYQVITDEKVEKRLDEENGIVHEVSEKDENMLKVFGVIYDIDPQSQVCVISENEFPENAAKIVISDIAAITVLTAAGLINFCRKDIK